MVTIKPVQVAVTSSRLKNVKETTKHLVSKQNCHQKSSVNATRAKTWSTLILISSSLHRQSQRCKNQVYLTRIQN